MLPRFCKLCYQTVDESIINLRRYSSVRNKRVTSDFYYNDDEADFKTENHETQEIYEEPEAQEQVPKKKKYCIVKCKRAKFNFYQGDHISKFEAMPLASRGWHHRQSHGDYFTINPLDEFGQQEMLNVTSTFDNYNLNSELLKNLENNNLIHPTPIQELAIENILSGSNVAITAETGCGKTYGFLIPLIEQILKWKPLSSDRGVNKPLAVILTPSKELTLQIAWVAKNLTKGLGINIIKFVGGNTKKILFNPPIGEVDIIISTVGIMSKLVSNDCYKMDHVRHIILDEADTLLDETFSQLTRHLLIKVPIGANRNPNSKFPDTAQLTLNSATIPQDIDETFENIVDPNSVKPVTTGYEHQIRVPQKFLRLSGSDKPKMLLQLVKPRAKNKIPVIVFSNTVETCNFTSIFLKQFGIDCVRLHKNMPLEVRKGKIMDFHNGHQFVLATTDAGARGIDTTVARDVINFDFPLVTSEYIHRCGRVGRIGSPVDCRIYNFISKPMEIVLTSKIEFAARKMKPIPMVDMIHNRYDEEGQFLHGNDVHETKWDEEGDDSDDDKDDDADTKDRNGKKFKKHAVQQ